MQIKMLSLIFDLICTRLFYMVLFALHYIVNFWLGQRRPEGDTEFRNPYTNASLGPLAVDEFRGEDLRDKIPGDICVKSYIDQLEIFPCYDETKSTCAFCYLNKRNQTLTMKGLRDEDVYENVEFDREYYVYGYRNNRFLIE